MNILSTIILTTLLISCSAITGSAAWQINLDVSTTDPNADTGIASNKLIIGTEPNATDTYDNTFDTVALLKGPLQAYILQPEFTPEQQKLWRDLRSETLPKEWTVEVYSHEKNNTISIKWEISAPDKIDFTLVDQDNNQEIGMRKSSEYSYNSVANTHKTFLLRVSENSSVNSSGEINSSSTGSNAVNASKGGGCGYIKDVKGYGGYPGSGSSALLNMAILFTPLFLISARRKSHP